MNEVTSETFGPVGRRFTLTPDAGPVRSAELVSATELGEAPPGTGARRPFAVTFRVEGPERPGQARYRVEAEGFEPLDLLLVPIGPDADGAERLEAIFA